MHAHHIIMFMMSLIHFQLGGFIWPLGVRELVASLCGGEPNGSDEKPVGACLL